MRKILFLALILLIIALGGGGVFVLTSLAQPLDLDEPMIVLLADSDLVYYAISGKEDVLLNLGQSVELSKGDKVKTGKEAQARIVFYGNQEVTLGEGTEVVISEGFIDELSPWLTKAKVTLKKGRVWARLLDLLHPDALFEMQADNVVATVRGTSFSLNKDDDKIFLAVYENSVRVNNDRGEAYVEDLPQDKLFTYFLEKEADPLLEQVYRDMPEDMRQRYMPQERAADAPKFHVRDMNSAEKSEPWTKGNLERNDLFKRELAEKQALIKQRLGVLPDEKYYALKRWGEKVALTLTFNEQKKQRLAEDFIAKRALEGELLTEKGKADLAEKVLHENNVGAEVELKIKRLKSLDPEWRRILKEDFNNQAEKQKTLFQENELQYLRDKFTRPALIENSGLTAEIEVTAKQNEASEESIKTEDPAEERNKEEAIASDAITAEQTTESATAATNEPTPLEPAADQTAPSENNRSFAAAKLSVSASRVNLAPGAQAVLHSVLQFADGQEIDVTDKTSWKLGPDDLTGLYAGELRGNTFVANENGGKAYVRAVFEDFQGLIHTDDLVLTVLVMY